MATIATPINGHYIDFEVDYHKTMAAVLTTCKAVKNHAWTLVLAKDIWRVSRDFKALLFQLENLRSNPAEIQSILPKIQNLNRTSNHFIDTASKSGLRNRSLTAAPLMTFIRYNERLSDIMERLALSIDPEVSASVRDAIAEYERGETVSLDSLV